MLAALSPREIAPGTHWIEGWVGSRAALYVMEKSKILTLLGFEPWPSNSLDDYSYGFKINSICFDVVILYITRDS
jgi:hypothetical protein